MDCIVTNPRGPVGYRLDGQVDYLQPGENVLEVAVVKRIVNTPINAAGKCGLREPFRRVTYGDQWKALGVNVAWPEPGIEPVIGQGTEGKGQPQPGRR